MFRYFENLVDPYEAYDEVDAPLTKLWPFICAYSTPFKKLFYVAAILSVIVAAVEIALIFYMGRIVDLLGGTERESFLAEHGLEVALVALFIVFLRPLIQALDVGILNNAILPNYGTLFRWRGRIANRIMQTPPAAGEAIFQVFDAITFSVAYLVGAAILLADADPRLALPLSIWVVLYALLVRAQRGHRPRRGQLHQHPFGQAVCP